MESVFKKLTGQTVSIQKDNIWGDKLVAPEKVLDLLKPGMSVYISTGVAEPRTLLKKLIYSERYNISDLELIQIFSFGEAVSTQEINSRRYRLKTFFQGWIADEAITSGRVDLIPGLFFQIPHLIGSGQLSIDAAFIQMTPPNEAGYCCLGISMDAARQAMKRARFVVGEINEKIPRTFGDTFIHVSELDYIVKSEATFMNMPFVAEHALRE